MEEKKKQGEQYKFLKNLQFMNLGCEYLIKIMHFFSPLVKKCKKKSESLFYYNFDFIFAT